MNSNTSEGAAAAADNEEDEPAQGATVEATERGRVEAAEGATGGAAANEVHEDSEDEVEVTFSLPYEEVPGRKKNSRGKETFQFVVFTSLM